MMSLRALILATTACATFGATAPAVGAPTLANSYSARLMALSDASALKRLVAEYRKDPTSFDAALKYIERNRPAIRQAYLAQTAAIAADKPAPGLGSGGAMLGVAVAAGAVAVLLGGGGGDDEGDGDARTPEPPSEPEPAPEPTPEPSPPLAPRTFFDGDAASFRTTEYKLNYGLETIGAAERYAQGPQGQGVKVSVLDTGIDRDNLEFDGKVDTVFSHSYIGNADAYDDTGGHGTHVAGIIAAAKNDDAGHGVAFGADLLVFKGIPGAPGETPSSRSGSIWGDAINRSVTAGAAVMNNSWVYSRSDGQGGSEAIPITDFRTRQELTDFLGTSTVAAFENARLNDLLTVTAAGNDGAGEVSVNAGVAYVLDEFRGYHIAVTATDQNNDLAYFSNGCGVARDFCLAAPGVKINATQDGGGTVIRSGTSMAAPHVTGAAAVLKSQSPELTAPEISQILFDTATDLGARGVDDIFGQGLLNLAEAQAPQGDLVIYEGSSTTGDTARLADSGVIASSAMGAALTSALAGRDLMVGDRYDRGYYLPADRMVATASAVLPSLNSISRSRITDDVALVRSARGMGVEYKGDAFSYTLKRGEIGTTGPTAAVSPLAFVTADFGADYSVAVGSGLSLDVGFSGAAGEGEHAAASIGFTADLAGASFGTRIGTLDEKGAVLGSSFLGGTGGGGTSRTAFIEVEANFNLSRDTMLSFVGTRSETNFSQSGLISSGRNLAGTSGRIALSRKGFLGSSGTLTAAVSTPLQVTRGELTVDLPQRRVAAASGTKSTGVTRSRSSIDFDSSERPYDFGLSYMTELSDTGLGLMVNGGYRAAGAASTPFAGLGVSFRF